MDEIAAGLSEIARGINLHQRSSRSFWYLEHHTYGAFVSMAASTEDSETLPFASRLADLYARQDVAPDERWGQVASTARSLADRLRTREGEGQSSSVVCLHRKRAQSLISVFRVVDEQSALGQTPLPRTLTALLNEALAAPSVPSGSALSAIYELLRTSANFCMDHGGDRTLFHVNYPQRY